MLGLRRWDRIIKPAPSYKSTTIAIACEAQKSPAERQQEVLDFIKFLQQKGNNGKTRWGDREIYALEIDLIFPESVQREVDALETLKASSGKSSGICFPPRAWQ